MIAEINSFGGTVMSATTDHVEAVDHITRHCQLGMGTQGDLIRCIEDLVVRGFHVVSYSLFIDTYNNLNQGHITMYHDDYRCHAIVYPNSFTSFGFSPMLHGSSSDEKTDQLINFLSMIAER